MLRIKAPVVLALLVAGSIGMTWIFWNQVSFGRRLGDAELAAYLSPESSTREAQHGVVELSLRWGEDAPGMDRWIERLEAVSRRPEPVIRRAAAWGMQFAPDDAVLGARLREIVANDPDELARRNAACALSTSKDAAVALPVLRGALRPYVVKAPAAGVVESVTAIDRRRNHGEVLARLRAPDGSRVEVAAPVTGRVRDVRVAEGATVAAGAPLAELAPSEDDVLAAAKGLAYAGTAEDADLLRPFLQAVGDVTPAMAEQCRRALAEIERRTKR